MFQRYGLPCLVDAGTIRGVDKSEGALLRISAKKAHETTVTCASGTKTVIQDGKSRPEVGKAAPRR